MLTRKETKKSLQQCNSRIAALRSSIVLTFLENVCGLFSSMDTVLYILVIASEADLRLLEHLSWSSL